MPRSLAAFLLASTLIANPALAAQHAPPPAPPPSPPAPALAQVPEPLSARFATPPAVAPPPAAPATGSSDRMEAVMRALYLLSTGGSSRPYPLIPQE